MRRERLSRIGRALLLALLFAVPALILRVARADDSPPPVATFAFQTQPGNTGVSRVVSPAVALVALKKNGTPSRFLAVTISLGPNPPNPGVLSGTLTQLTDSNGVATFNDLKIDWLGNGYTLVAQTVAANGAFSATSNPFNEIRVGDPCLGPTPVCSSGCPDADGDGLNDAWEKADLAPIPASARINEVFPAPLGPCMRSGSSALASALRSRIKVLLPPGVSTRQDHEVTTARCECALFELKRVLQTGQRRGST